MQVFILKLIAVILTINLCFSHRTAVESNSSQARREAPLTTLLAKTEQVTESTTSKTNMSERIKLVRLKRIAFNEINNSKNNQNVTIKKEDDFKEEEAEIVKKLFQIGLLDEGSNKSLSDSLGSDRNRKIKYDLNVQSNSQIRDKMKFYNMSKLYEEGSQKDPVSRIIILKNETTLLVLHKFNKYYYWEHGQTAAAIIIFTMIVVGNISILHRLKSCRRRRSNVNYFIVQLAIADLFVGLFSITLDTVLRFQKAFTYGLMACRASKYIQVLFIYSSTYLLVALSIDRWEAVVKPLAFTQNRSRGYYLVAGAWFLAFISATPVTISVTIKEIEGFPQCWITYDVLGWKIYMIYLTSSLLVIPALIIAICYTHIVYTIWRKGQLVAQQKQVRKCNESSSFKKKQQLQLDLAQQGNMNHSSISSNMPNQLKLTESQLKATFHESQQVKVRPFVVESNLKKREEEEYDISTEDGYVSSDEQFSEEEEEEEEQEQEEEEEEYHAEEEGVLEVEKGETVEVGGQTPNEDSLDAIQADPSHNNNNNDNRLFEMNQIRAEKCDTSISNGNTNIVYSTSQRAKHESNNSVNKMSTRVSAPNTIILRTATSDSANKSTNETITCTTENLTTKIMRTSQSPLHKLKQAKVPLKSLTNGQQQQQQPQTKQKARNSSRKNCRRQITTLSATSNTTTTTVTGIRANRNFNAQQHGSGVIPKARIKTIKMTLVIVAAFVLCWSPFCIINLCSVFGLMKNDTNWSIALMTLSQSLAHLNSAVNPIIFWLFSSKRSGSTSTASSGAGAANRKLGKGGLIRNTHQNLCLSIRQILCCRICYCLKGRYITTDSRMFESTGTSAISPALVQTSSNTYKSTA